MVSDNDNIARYQNVCKIELGIMSYVLVDFLIFIAFWHAI